MNSPTVGPLKEPEQGQLEPAPQVKPLGVATEEQANQKGVEILGQKVEKPEVPQLAGKIISKTPSKRTAWESVKRFFNRHFFTPITNVERQKANEIKKLSLEIQTELDKASAASQKAKNADKKLRSSYPSDQSVKNCEDYLAQARAPLFKARQLIDSLKAKQEEANELAEAHSTFDSLAANIGAIEHELNLQEGQLAIGEKLLDLEKAMKAYKPEEKWAQFIEINERRNALHEAVRKITNENPALKNDSRLANYVGKSTFLPSDSHQVLSIAYPDLKGQIERLFDSTLEIVDQRIANLNKKIEVLVPLFTKYKELSKQIDHLESCLHDTTLYARIYRLFHNTEKLEAQLEKAEKQSQDIFNGIEKECQFDQEEIAWIKKKGQYSPELAVLSSNIREVRKGFSYLELRQPIANELSLLIQKLSEYSEAKILEKHTKTDKKDAAKLVERRKNNILSDIKAFAPQLKKIKERKQADLPANFDSLDALSQLKVLIPLAFPSLSVRTQIFADSIIEHKLEKEFSQAIEQADIDEEVLTAEIELEEEGVLEEEGAQEEEALITEEAPLPPPRKLPPPTSRNAGRALPPPPTKQGIVSETVASENVPQPPPPPPYNFNIPPKASSVVEKEEVAPLKQSDEPLSLADQLKQKQLKKVPTDLTEEKKADKKEALLDDIRKGGHQLKPVKKDGLSSATDQKPSLLDQIRNKDKLKLRDITKTAAPITPKKDLKPPVRDFKTLEAGISKGEISINDVTEEEKQELKEQFTALSLLAAMVQRRQAIGNEDDTEEDDYKEEDWQ